MSEKKPTERLILTSLYKLDTVKFRELVLTATIYIPEQVY